MDHPHGALVDHDEAAARAGDRRELVRQPGDATVEKAVRALRGGLAGAHQGGGDGVHRGGELHLVECAGAHEKAPSAQRGRVVARRERPVDVVAEPPHRAREVGGDPGRDAERHRPLGRPVSAGRG